MTNDTPTTAAPELRVNFGSISIGADTCRLGFTLDRENLPLEEAEWIFCGHRLSVQVRKGASGEQTLPGMDDANTLDGVADSKSLNVKPDSYRCGLTFVRSDISLADLTQFAQAEGTLTILSVEAIDE